MKPSPFNLWLRVKAENREQQAVETLHQVSAYIIAPSRWSLGGVTSGGDVSWACNNRVTTKFVFFAAVLRNHASHSTKCVDKGLWHWTRQKSCLELWPPHPAKGTHCVQPSSEATRSSKGIASEPRSKIRRGLFSVWLTSSVMCRRTFTNLFLNVKSLTVMSLITERGEAANRRTFFFPPPQKRTSSALLRFFAALFLIQQLI